MRTEFLCISVLRVAPGPRVKLVSYKSALNPPVVYSTDRSKAVVPVLVLFFLALWFILRADLFYVLPCVILFLCFSVLLALRLPRLGKRELILVLFVRLFDLCLFGFVGFLFLLVSGKGCGLWLWHSMDFSLMFFFRWTVTRLRGWSHVCVDAHIQSYRKCCSPAQMIDVRLGKVPSRCPALSDKRFLDNNCLATKITRNVTHSNWRQTHMSILKNGLWLLYEEIVCMQLTNP